MHRFVFHRIRGRIREALFPAEKGLNVSSWSTARRTAYVGYFDAATARFGGATSLFESGKPIPAWVLYREGCFLLALADHALADEAPDLADADIGRTLDRFIDGLRAKDEAFGRRLREALAIPKSNDPFDVDLVPPRELKHRVAALAAVVRDLVDLMAPKTTQQQRARRALRRWAVGLAFVSCVAVFLATTVRPKSIAFHKEATSSSAAYDTTAAGAVDGKVYQPFGFHSALENQPWLRIDLGRPFDLKEARVFGRHDCCFDQSTPLVFELSDDGTTFRAVGDRKVPFDQLDAWVVPLHMARARYVRLRSQKTGVLVLAEVELYGEPAR
jgi:hypothetical protein